MTCHKGYDSDAIRDDLTKRGIEPVIPPRSNRKTPIEYDHEAYQRRNLIERSSQAVSPYCNALRKNRQSLPFNAMHRSRKALDKNCQHGLGSAGYRRSFQIRHEGWLRQW
jgi:hypothetical protein